MNAALLVDDGELDELRAGSVILREIDKEPAEVHAFHATDRLGDRRRARARLPQRVNEDLRGDVAFHRSLGELRILRYLAQLLILANHGDVTRGSERPKDAKAVARGQIAAQAFLQR